MLDVTLTPADKDLIAQHGEDIEAATDAVLARLTDALRPQLLKQYSAR
jgi:hypothetical protein